MGWPESLPFRDESFATLISCNVFHYVERPTRALQEAVRVLVPGGYPVLKDWCADFLPARPLGFYPGIRRRPLCHVYRVGKSGRLLKTAGFQSVKIERFRMGRFWGLMAATVRKKRSGHVSAVWTVRIGWMGDRPPSFDRLKVATKEVLKIDRHQCAETESSVYGIICRAMEIGFPSPPIGAMAPSMEVYHEVQRL